MQIHYDAFSMGFSNRSWEATLDSLSAYGIERWIRIGHIFDPTKAQAHELTRFARVNGTRITYP